MVKEGETGDFLERLTPEHLRQVAGCPVWERRAGQRLASSY